MTRAAVELVRIMAMLPHDFILLAPVCLVVVQGGA